MKADLKGCDGWYNTLKGADRSVSKGQLPTEAAGRDNEKALLIVSESYGHEDLRQTRQYLGLVIDEQRDVGLRRAEYLARTKRRMQQGLPPEKDFSIRISR